MSKVSFSTTGKEQPCELFPAWTRYYVRLGFTQGVLGTVPKSDELYKRYIASKAPASMDTSDELETVLPKDADEFLQQMANKGWTGFHTDAENRPLLYDYAFKGFFKEVCGSLRTSTKSESFKLTSFKKRIDKLLFVAPRQIVLHMPEGMTMEQIYRKVEIGGETRLMLPVLERPIRVQTAQGERVALVCSDMCPPGTWCEFTVTTLGSSITFGMMQEWLKYGVLGGMGQWRSGGYGTFRVDVRVDESELAHEPADLPPPKAKAKMKKRVLQKAGK